MEDESEASLNGLQGNESEESDQDQIMEKGKPAAQNEDDDGQFKQIKLASKYAAFVKSNKIGHHYIYYSTRNQSTKGETPLLKEPLLP